MARLNPSRMSMPMEAFGPDSVLMKPILTLSAALAPIAIARASPPMIVRTLSPLSLFALHAHAFVRDLAALDDDLAVELNGAVAHRHVVMPARVALAAALRIRPGGEKEVAGKCARRRTMPLRRIAMQCDAIPERLRVHAPAEVRDRIRIAIGGGRFAVVQPIAHQLRVHAALHIDDVSFANGELHCVIH